MVEEHILGLLENLDGKQSVLRASQTAASKAVNNIKEFITRNDFYLTERTVDDNSVRNSFTNKRTREEQLLYHAARAEENKKFILKVQKEKEYREKKERLRQENSMKRILASLKNEEIAHQEYLKFIDEQKQLRKKEVQETAQQRKDALQKAKIQGDKDLLLVKNTVPLYKKIEEKYRYEVAIPKLEKQKEELAKKREQAKLETIESLREHAKKHDNLISQNKAYSDFSSRVSPIPYPKSRFMVNVLNEDKEKNNLDKEKDSARRKLIRKKKHYSEIVKEMFYPKTVKPPEEVAETQKHSIPERASYASPTIPKRQYKRNYMIPVPLLKPQPSFTDYLADRRGYRQKNPLESFSQLKDQFHSVTHEDIGKLKTISKKIEDKMKLTEAKYGHFSPGKLGGIKKAANLNNMIISSIKAKLAILESMKD